MSREEIQKPNTGGVSNRSVPRGNTTTEDSEFPWPVPVPLDLRKHNNTALASAWCGTFALVVAIAGCLQFTRPFAAWLSWLYSLNGQTPVGWIDVVLPFVGVLAILLGVAGAGFFPQQGVQVLPRSHWALVGIVTGVLAVLATFAHLPIAIGALEGHP